MLTSSAAVGISIHLPDYRKIPFGWCRRVNRTVKARRCPVNHVKPCYEQHQVGVADCRTSEFTLNENSQSRFRRKAQAASVGILCMVSDFEGNYKHYNSPKTGRNNTSDEISKSLNVNDDGNINRCWLFSPTHIYGGKVGHEISPDQLNWIKF